MKLKTKFKAIYNPYTKRLVVKYGNSITEHFFEEIQEWCVVNYNADDKNHNYLHIQTDYDETFQLLFYPRIEGDESLNEEFGTYYNSGEKKKLRNIKIVHTDKQFNEAVQSLRGFDKWINTNN